MKKEQVILIIDDDERNIFALTAVMQSKGFQVRSAMDGEAGISIMRTVKEIDLVLMDIMMPVMDGYEAMQLIRKDLALKTIPIIALTANAMNGDKEKCMEAGATDYGAKPVDVRELMEIIKRCLS